MTSKRFSKVSPALWRSQRFLTLQSVEAKLLYVYFLSCEHQTSAGCYVIPDGYAAADLAWDMKTYHKAREQLVVASLITFDADNFTVFIDRWFKHCPPMNPSHVQGIQRIIEELDSEVIAEKVQAEFDEALSFRNPLDTPANAPKISQSLRDRLGAGSRGAV